MSPVESTDSEWAGALCIVRSSAMSYIEHDDKVFWLGGQARSNADIFR